MASAAVPLRNPQGTSRKACLENPDLGGTLDGDSGVSVSGVFEVLTSRRPDVDPLECQASLGLLGFRLIAMLCLCCRSQRAKHQQNHSGTIQMCKKL